MENCVNTSLKWKALTGALSTSKYEQKQEELRQRAEKISNASESDKIKEFLDLNDFVHSDVFKKTKKEIDALKYQGSEPQQKEKEFKKKSSDKRIKNYYKLNDSAELEFYHKHHDTDKLKRYHELKQYLESEAFNRDKDRVNEERKKMLSELEEKRKRYKSLKQELSWFLKLENSEQFNDFLHFKDSETFKHYLDLEKEVRNYSLKAVKQKLNNDKKKYQREKKTLEKRYKELKKQSAKADKSKTPFEHQKELERIKETLSKGTLDQKIKDSDINQSHEYIKIKEFENLKKNKRVKNASKYYFSDKYKKYQEVKGSAKEQELKELQEFMKGPYKEEKEKAKQYTFKNSDAYSRKEEFKVLKKDNDIKRVLKTEKSQAFKDFKSLDGSKEIEDYESLKAYVESDEFKEKKKYLKDSKRFKRSEEYEKQQRYKALVKDTEVKFYLKHKDDKDIEEFRSWECTFDDDFSDNSSATKWSPLPFPAASFIRGTYSQWDEDQFYSEDKNHFFSSGKLVLKTTREEAEGMAWHPKMGFVPKKFNYTSANLNSGKAFSQQFGKFEAKVKCAHAKGLSHILALSSGRLAPQIQLFKQIEKGDNKFSTGLIYAGRNGIPSRKECVVSGLDLSKDYHIFTLIWNENLIEWKVNGVTLAKQTNDVPKAPLFWNLLAVKPSEETLDKSSAEMEMEWVRAYKKKVS